MAEYKTDRQVNYGFGQAFEATGKAPVVAKRIWETLADAQAYVDSLTDTAIAGLVLTVINDGENNGVYFVTEAAGDGSATAGVLVKLGSASDTVTVDSADDVLALANGVISSEISLAYDSSSKKLNLVGKDSTVISAIDCASFVKDGMLKGSALHKATATTGKVSIDGTEYSLSGLTSGKTYIVLVWNDDAETDPMTIDVTTLVDVYTAGNGISIAGNVVSIDTSVTATKASVDALSTTVTAIGNKKIQGTKISEISDSGLTLTGANVKVTNAAATLPSTYSAPTADDSIDTAVAKLAKGVSEARSSAGVTKVGGLTGEVALDTTTTATGAVKFTANATNNTISAEVQGLGTAAEKDATEFATAAQGAKADTSVQYADASGNVTIAGKLTAAGVTGIATPTANSDAANKEYVDGKFTWTTF